MNKPFMFYMVLLKQFVHLFILLINSPTSMKLFLTIIVFRLYENRKKTGIIWFSFHYSRLLMSQSDSILQVNAGQLWTVIWSTTNTERAKPACTERRNTGDLAKPTTWHAQGKPLPTSCIGLLQQVGDEDIFISYAPLWFDCLTCDMKAHVIFRSK